MVRAGRRAIMYPVVECLLIVTWDNLEESEKRDLMVLLYLKGQEAQRTCN